MRKPMKHSLLFALSFVLLSACSRETPAPDSGTLVLGVAVPPQAGLLRAMAPEGLPLDIVTLIDGAQNPHSFEPGAKQLADLSRCSLYVSAGLPFETALVPRLQALNSSMRIVWVEPDAEHDHDHHDEHEDHDDPHWWMSTDGMQRQTDVLLEALAALDPDHVAEWTQGHKAFVTRLAKADADTKARFEPYRGRAFLAYHPAWGQFAAETGLRQFSIEQHGAAPTAKHLAELSRAVQDEGIRAILVQSESEAERAKPFADSLGLAIVHLNPLEPDPFVRLQKTIDAVLQSLAPNP